MSSAVFPIFRTAQYGSLAPYVHEEPLEGLPESVVLWARSIGHTVGIAPLGARANLGDQVPAA